MISAKSKATLLILTILIVGLLISKFVMHKSEEAPRPPMTTNPSSPKSSISKNQGASSKANIPDYVYEVYHYVIQHGEAPEGYVGGREFKNREKKLPNQDEQLHAIRYQEWDVKPKIKGRNRGAERLITGSNSSAYYTRNHYKTFINLH